MFTVKKTSKSKRRKAERQQWEDVINKVDDSWVIEHARQVRQDSVSNHSFHGNWLGYTLPAWWPISDGVILDSS